jgi:hypothetical protein
MALRHWFILCDVRRVGRPPRWLTTAVAMLDIWGHVRNAAGAYRLAWIDGESELSRYDVARLGRKLALVLRAVRRRRRTDHGAGTAVTQAERLTHVGDGLVQGVTA